MLNAKRAFSLSSQSAPLLPQVPEFKDWYDWGIKPRQGQLIMIAGRSGSQKSGLAMFWVCQMGLPTLYLSGDMSGFEASSRLVSMRVHETTERVEAGMMGPDRKRYTEALDDLPITFSFSSPITWHGIMTELDAYMEIHNQWPEVIVIDNLMDIEGCESEYQAQQSAMQDITALARLTGSTVIVTHHATDKDPMAEEMPGRPPSRKQIKNGLAEKPQLTLTVGLEPLTNEFKVACVKQRGGRSDPSARDYIRMRAIPEFTRFTPLERRHAYEQGND